MPKMVNFKLTATGQFWMPDEASGGGGGGGTTYRYYRWLITADNGSNNICGFSRLELRTSVGGANIATGGTPSAGSTFSDFVPANAFNGSETDQWYHGNNAGHTGDEWIMYDLGAGNEAAVVQYAADARSSSTATSQTPKDWTFQGSNDASTWDDLHTASEQTAWGLGDFREFTL